MKITINGIELWDIDPPQEILRKELERIGAGDSLGFLITDIEHSAERVIQGAPSTDPQETKTSWMN